MAGQAYSDSQVVPPLSCVPCSLRFLCGGLPSLPPKITLSNFIVTVTRHVSRLLKNVEFLARAKVLRRHLIYLELILLFQSLTPSPTSVSRSPSPRPPMSAGLTRPRHPFAGGPNRQAKRLKYGVFLYV